MIDQSIPAWPATSCLGSFGHSDRTIVHVAWVLRFAEIVRLFKILRFAKILRLFKILRLAKILRFTQDEIEEGLACMILD